MSEMEKRMCKLICSKETVLVASDLKITPTALRQRFYRLRKRIDDAQTLVNQANAMKQICPRLRKLLTSWSLKELESS